MRSLADFKRASTVGSKWKFRANWINGEEKIRTVKIKQSNAVGFDSLRNPDEVSWLYHPKRDELYFHNGGMYVLNPETRHSQIELIEKHNGLFKTVDFYLYYEPIKEGSEQ